MKQFDATDPAQLQRALYDGDGLMTELLDCALSGAMPNPALIERVGVFKDNAQAAALAIAGAKLAG